MARPGVRSRQRAFTLVEVLCSVAIMLSVISLTTFVLIVGHKQRQYAVAFSDQTQQLRVAMQQIAQDLTGTRLVANTSSTSVYTLEVKGFQPFALRSPQNPADGGIDYGSSFDWNQVDSGWPGDLLLFADVHVRYTISNGILRREVFAEGFDVVTSEVLLSGIEGSSILPAGTSGVYEVILTRSAKEGGRGAAVRSSFYLS